MDWLVDYMVGPAFCEVSEDVERCQAAIKTLLPLAIPALNTEQDHQDEVEFCHMVLGVC